MAGEISRCREVNCGIVQGSVLGATLFLVAISSLQPLHNSIKYIKYANDMIVVFPGVCNSMIHEEWVSINKWASKCNLKLNENKMKVACFCLDKCAAGKAQILKNVTLGQYECKFVNTINVLGVSISTDLRVTSHISNIVQKCNVLCYQDAAESRDAQG